MEKGCNLIKKLLLLTVLLSSVLYAETITTYQGGTDVLRYATSGVSVQHFTVPANYVCTSVTFPFSASNNHHPAFVINVQLYRSNHTLIGTASISAADFPGAWYYLSLNKDNSGNPLRLSAGSYYMQLFTNQTQYNSLLATMLKQGSTYDGGYAATGWSGGTAVSPPADFYAWFTVELCLYLNADIAGPGGIGVDYRDGYVNMTDLMAMETQWLDNTYVGGDPSAGCDTFLAADVSGPQNVPDCNVDLHDFAAIQNSWMDCIDPANPDECPLVGDYTIVIADTAAPAVQTAATELHDYLLQMTGYNLPIVNETAYTSGPMIAVGFNEKLPTPLCQECYAELAEEEILNKSCGPILLLAGGSPRGTLYAVYEFLHRKGVRWYTPQYTFVPQLGSIELQSEDYRFKPLSMERSQLSGNNPTNAWSARNRLNSIRLWVDPGETYGYGYAQGPDMHTWTRMISVPVLEAHPQWLAQVNGVRELPVGHTWGLCLSNQECRNYLIERTLVWARANPDRKGVWVGQNDGSNYCTCANCQAFYDAHGGKPSSLIVQTVNELADALAAEMPDRVAKTLAYSWSVQPPTNMTVRDNAIIMFCAGGSFIDPIETDPGRQWLRDAVAQWRPIAKNLEVYLYSAPFDNYWFVTPCTYSSCENIKWGLENGITSFYTHLSGFGNTYGSESLHLRSWIYARLMWDPSQNIQSLIEDFVHGYYGPAAQTVLNAIAMVHSDVFDGDGKVIEYNTSSIVPHYVNSATMRAINTMFEDTHNSLTDETYRSRLRFAWIGYLWSDFWLGYSGVGSYSGSGSQGTWAVPLSDAAVRRSYAPKIKQYMLEHGVNVLGERKQINPNQLAIDMIGIDWPAYKLAGGNAQTVVVPNVAGQLFDLKDTSLNFSPLKPYWGYFLTKYPLYSSWRDYINGAMSNAYTVKTYSASNPNTITIQSNISGIWNAEKTATMSSSGELHVKLRVTALQAAETEIWTSPMFDLQDIGFGIHPTLYVEKSNRSWTPRVMGSETDFWYIAGAIDIADATGRMVLASQTRPEGVLLTFYPAEVNAVNFEYDCYGGWPDDQSHKLDMMPRSPKVPLTAGSSLEINFKVKMLPNAYRFVQLGF